MKPVLPPFRPKMIVWQLVADNGHAMRSEQNNSCSLVRDDTQSVAGHVESLSTNECHLVIDSIVRLGRPIIVFTGQSVLQRPDLYPITEYAFALGLKVIIEVHPQELSEDVVRKYSVFGSRIFRILVDGCIVEDIEHRYQQSDNYHLLEQAVDRLRGAKLELHLGSTVHQPDLRQLAFHHDYAIRRSAVGFYCHFSFERHVRSDNRAAENIESLVEAVAQMKGCSPRDMYCSPQCVRYGHKAASTLECTDKDVAGSELHLHSEWLHWCMGGKTFAYIDAVGTVHLCAGIPLKCGELRQSEYDFSKIWENSAVMRTVRRNEWSCVETREQCFPMRKSQNIESEV